MNGVSLYSNTLPNQNFRFRIRAGKYIGMLIRFAGNNAAAHTMTNDDCGIVIITKGGEQKYNFDFAALQTSYNTIEMGSIESFSTSGAGFAQSCFVPFVEAFDDVCLDIQNNNDWEVVLTAPNLTASLIADGTVEFIGVQADDVAVSPYELQFVNHHLSPGAAGTFIEPVYNENPDVIYIEYDSHLTHLAVTKDGKPFVDYMSVQILNTLTCLFGKVETFPGNYAWLKVDLNPTRDEAGSSSNDVKLQYTVDAATTIKVLVKSRFMTPNRLSRSIISTNNALELKAVAKQNAGFSIIASRLRGGKIEKFS